jgi:hypothetical protein
VPKFSYRVRDQAGGRKTGILEALDHRLAREELIEAGWRIDQLLPADESVPAAPVPRPEQRPAQPAPEFDSVEDWLNQDTPDVPQHPHKPLPSRPLVAVFAPTETVIAPPAWLRPLMIMIVLGLALGLFGHLTGLSKQKAREPKKYEIRVVVTGILSLSNAPGRRPEGVKVRVQLPEIPLDVSHQADDLELTDEGDFLLELIFESTRVPSQLRFTASKAGYKDTEVKAVRLTGDPRREPLRANLSKIALTRAGR